MPAALAVLIVAEELLSTRLTICALTGMHSAMAAAPSSEARTRQWFVTLESNVLLMNNPLGFDFRRPARHLVMNFGFLPVLSFY
jgi:hypothetical protein